jgi:hypothetical protein
MMDNAAQGLTDDLWDQMVDDTIVPCAECGHLHFNQQTKQYIPDPLAPECSCKGQPSIDGPVPADVPGDLFDDLAILTLAQVMLHRISPAKRGDLYARLDGAVSRRRLDLVYRFETDKHGVDADLNGDNDLYMRTDGPIVRTLLLTQ